MDNNTQYKICPNCQSYIQGNSNFCGICGHQFVYQQPQQYIQYPYQQTQPQYVPQYITQTVVAPSPKFGYILGILSSIVMLVCCFLPYAYVEAFGYRESITFFDFKPDVYFFIGVAFLGFAASVGQSFIGTFIMGIFGCIISVAEFFNFQDNIQVNANEYAGFIHNSFGIYLSIIGSVVLFISSFIILSEKDN